MPERRNSFDLPAPAVAAAGFLLPGLGYWLIGERVRAYAAGTAILALFLLGLLVGGIRVIDVPGYDDAGQPQMIDGARIDANTGRPEREWLLRQRPFAALLNKPWIIPQVLAGPITIVSGFVSVNVADSVEKATARPPEIGTLFTAVAGMLNLIVLMDATYRAAQE